MTVHLRRGYRSRRRHCGPFFASRGWSRDPEPQNDHADSIDPQASNADKSLMSHHILLSVEFDLEAMQRGAEREENPRHILYEVSRRLDATVHVPRPSKSFVDRALSKIVGRPGHWAVARRLARTIDDADVVFAAGDDNGLALVLACLLRRKRPKVVMGVMAPGRRRQTILFRLFRRRIDRLVVNNEHKRQYLGRLTRFPDDRIFLWADETDTEFFAPGPRRPRSRPLIFAAGREQRDYRTLAAATEQLDVDVEVCALSPNAGDKTPGTFPDPVPANMSFHPYPWPEFRQAYRDADVVVVTLLDHDYSAGATSLFEAMACGRPVVMTRVVGPAERLIDAGLILGAAPGDVAGLQRAIEEILSHPDEAAERATRARELVLREHSARVQRERLIELLQSLAPTADRGLAASAGRRPDPVPARD
jgi:glycosyltransferase involved in cell wall biosynthesis